LDHYILDAKFKVTKAEFSQYSEFEQKLYHS